MLLPDFWDSDFNDELSLSIDILPEFASFDEEKLKFIIQPEEEHLPDFYSVKVSIEDNDSKATGETCSTPLSFTVQILPNAY